MLHHICALIFIEGLCLHWIAILFFYFKGGCQAQMRVLHHICALIFIESLCLPCIAFQFFLFHRRLASTNASVTPIGYLSTEGRFYWIAFLSFCFVRGCQAQQILHHICALNIPEGLCLHLIDIFFLFPRRLASTNASATGRSQRSGSSLASSTSRS